MKGSKTLYAESPGPGKMKGVLNTDGASIGNPGPAGIGALLAIASGEVVEISEPIGRATSNEAEYTALIRGLEEAESRGVDDIEVLSDSELMVRQVAGEYRVKSARLKPLFARVGRLVARFVRFRIKHVPREFNRAADRLANGAARRRT